MSDRRSRLITGSGFIAWLAAHGIVPADTRRVVIDADFRSAVLLYVEALGDERLISVEPPPGLNGVPVVRVGETSA